MGILPGTRIKVSKPGGLPIKSAGEDAWQATKLELSAALGAARERGCELEWRLCQAERQLAHQVCGLTPVSALISLSLSAPIILFRRPPPSVPPSPSICR